MNILTDSQPRWPGSALFRRSIMALILVISTIGVTVATGTLSESSARAASYVDRGPSAAADRFNDQYVFWRGTDNALWEAFYNAYTGAWNGPIRIGMGPLGSEPSVTVSYFQSYAGPGGHLFNAQFVYWKGSNANTIWMAYWEGGWHGPIEIAPGNSNGGIQGYPCSQPTADALESLKQPLMNVYWQGLADSSSGSCFSSALMEGDNGSVNPISATDYFGPIDNSAQSGNIGSSPSAAAEFTGTSVGTTCLCAELIAWRGQDGRLWSIANDYANQSFSNAKVDSAAATLGSPPSVGGNIAGRTSYDIAWAGQDGILWLDTFDPNTGNYGGLQSLPQSGTLGSAPTVAEGPGGQFYAFWKGTDANLWEAYWNPSNSKWSIINLHMGPLG